MSTNYQIKTEFSILDKASSSLASHGKKGEALEKAFAGPLMAAEKRFSALEAVAKKSRCRWVWCNCNRRYCCNKTGNSAGYGT